MKKYVADGWKVLNKAKTGSLGRLHHKYGCNMCYELAKHFKTKKEFCVANRSAYFTAMAKGWLKDYAWLKHAEMPKTIYTFEECKNAAKDCKSRTEFRNKHWLMYGQSRKNGWIDSLIDSKVISHVIIKYDLKGNFMEEMPKIHQIFGKKADLINQVSKTEKHYAYGFLWYMKEDVLDENLTNIYYIKPTVNLLKNTIQELMLSKTVMWANI